MSIKGSTIAMYNGYVYVAGYFRGVLIFVIFVGHLLVTKISTYENNLVGC